MPRAGLQTDELSSSGHRLQVLVREVNPRRKPWGIGAEDTSLPSTDGSLNLPRLRVRWTEKRARCADC